MTFPYSFPVRLLFANSTLLVRYWCNFTW